LERPGDTGRAPVFVRPRLRLASAADDPNPSRRTDELAPLVERAREGDARAVRTLIATLSPALLRVVRRILGVSHPDVEDVLQESLVAVMDALDRFRGESTVLHFACRVAVLTTMNARRRSLVRERNVVRDRDPESSGSHSPSGAERMESREVVLRLLDELPEAQAEVLALHCALGYTMSEIAAASGVPVNTVRGRLVTAKQVLRGKLLDEASLRELEGGGS